MSKNMRLWSLVAPGLIGLGAVLVGCFPGPQYGVIAPYLATGPTGGVIIVFPTVATSPTPTATPPISVIIFAGSVNVAPTSDNPPVTMLANYSPLQVSKPIAVSVTAQLATSRLGIQLVQMGTSTVLASNLNPVSSTTTLSYIPASTQGVTILVNDTVNPNTLQSIYVQVIQ